MYAVFIFALDSDFYHSRLLICFQTTVRLRNKHICWCQSVPGTNQYWLILERFRAQAEGNKGSLWYDLESRLIVIHWLRVGRTNHCASPRTFSKTYLKTRRAEILQPTLKSSGVHWLTFLLYTDICTDKLTHW